MFSDFAHLLALNIAITSVGICTAALCVCWLWTGRSLPLQYGLLLTAVVLVVVCPVPLLLTARQGTGLLNVSVAPQVMRSSSSRETQTIAPDVSAQPVGSRPQATAAAFETRPSSSAVETGTEPQPADVLRVRVTDLRNTRDDEGSNYWRTAVTLRGRWPDVLVASWLAISLLFAARLVCGLYYLRILRLSLRDPADTDLMRAAGEACAGARNFCPSRLKESKLVPAPLTIGFIQPTIVVPEKLSSVLSNEQLTRALAHEVAHVVRRDTVAALIQSTATVLFWWNPAVLLANQRLRVLREQICDDYVVSRLGLGHALAEAMVRLAEHSLERLAVPSLSLRFWVFRRIRGQNWLVRSDLCGHGRRFIAC